MKSSRELFEEFLCSEYPLWAPEAIQSAFFVGDDKTGFATVKSFNINYRL